LNENWSDEKGKRIEGGPKLEEKVNADEGKVRGRICLEEGGNLISSAP
jgi:hypothetical protein